MQGKVIVVCNGCKQRLGEVAFDTAMDTSPGMFSKVEKEILVHREYCIFYSRAGSHLKGSAQPPK